MQLELNSPMLIGNSSVIKFDASLVDYMGFPFDKIEVYLSTSQPSETIDETLNYIPQVLSNYFVDEVLN